MVYTNCNQLKNFVVIADYFIHGTNDRPRYPCCGESKEDAVENLIKRVPWLKVHDVYEIDARGRRII